MKHLTVISLLFLLLQQASFAQEADPTATTFTIKVRPVGKVTTTGEYPSPTHNKKGSSEKSGNDTLKGLELGLDYPAEARDLGISGVVVVSYQYDKKGNTKNIVLEKGIHPALDEAALNYVRGLQEGKAAKDQSKVSVQSTGEPGMKPGTIGLDIVIPMGIRYTIPIRFSLDK